MAQNYQINFTFTLLHMLFITIAILLGIVVLVLFKTFPKYGINTFAAIIFNYMFAACSGWVMMRGQNSIQMINSERAFLTGIPLGFLFLLVFYLISQTTQKAGIAVAAVANKMSVIMSFLFSVFMLHQPFHWYMILAVTMALLSIYLTAGKNKNSSGSFLLPLSLFIGSGLIDVSINAADAWFITNNDQGALYSTIIFSSAFVFGMIVVTIGMITGKVKGKVFFSFKSILAGLALGVPNYFSIYFIFRALDAGVYTSAQLFPILNVANVAFSAIIAFLIFREKLSILNVIGILLAVFSIILFSV